MLEASNKVNSYHGTPLFVGDQISRYASVVVIIQMMGCEPDVLAWSLRGLQCTLLQLTAIYEAGVS